MAEQLSLADTFQALTRAGKANHNPARDAWVLTSSFSNAKGNPNNTVQMTINPNSVKFDQPKRISSARRTIGGTTYFNWSDRKGRNLDNLTMTISGETGPISGLGKTSDLQKKTGLITTNGTFIGTRAQKNAQNWAKFYCLTAEPSIDPLTLKPNVWSIRYKSLLFPDVIFTGFFLEVLQFSDEAASPFSKRYTARFIVTGVSPDILTIQNLIGSVDVPIQQGVVVGTAGTKPPGA